jgi:hypothetical protein
MMQFLEVGGVLQICSTNAFDEYILQGQWGEF